jgi:D-3-phosphoglycerate dehydrogenase
MSAQTVLVTDHAWPDLDIERGIVEQAGFRLAAGPAAPASAAEIAQLVGEFQPASILTCWAQVDAQAISASAVLRHVGRIGVGLDNIDTAACAASGIVVTNVPDYCVEEVSDHAVGFALAWTRGLVAFDREVRTGLWDPSQARLRRLSALSVGIVGYGRIGAASARKFRAFGCTVRAHTLVPPREPGPIEFVSLDRLLELSDIVVLHVPLTPETFHLIDRKRLAKMRRGALLVNVSRGGLVDSASVVEALASGHLGGAALDVLESEPQVPAEMRASPNTLLTPHVAFSSDASLAELRRRAAEEAVRMLRGEPPHHPIPVSRS